MLPVVAPVVAAVAVVGAGGVVPRPVAPQAGTVQVAAVQGNTPRPGLDFNAELRAVLDNHVEQTVALLPWQLPVLLEVRVAIGKDAAAEPLPALDIEPAPQPVSAMPVPVGKEEC